MFGRDFVMWIKNSYFGESTQPLDPFAFGNFLALKPIRQFFLKIKWSKMNTLPYHSCTWQVPGRQYWSISLLPKIVCLVHWPIQWDADSWPFVDQGLLESCFSLDKPLGAIKAEQIDFCSDGVGSKTHSRWYGTAHLFLWVKTFTDTLDFYHNSPLSIRISITIQKTIQKYCLTLVNVKISILLFLWWT